MRVRIAPSLQGLPKSRSRLQRTCCGAQHGENNSPLSATALLFLSRPSGAGSAHAGSPCSPGLGSEDVPWSSRQGQGKSREAGALVWALPPTHQVTAGKSLDLLHPGFWIRQLRAMVWFSNRRPSVRVRMPRSLHSGTPARGHPRARTGTAEAHGGCPASVGDSTCHPSP